MELVRDVCSSTHALRKAAGKRLRLPLRTLTVSGPRSDELKDYVDIISDEVNVKEVVLTTDVEGIASEVLTVVPAAIGPRLGKDTQKVIGAVKRGEWVRKADGSVEAAGIVLEDGEYTLVLQPVDDRCSKALSNRAGVISLDLETDGELEREGLARDLVRLVQAARRDAGLHISDRIDLNLVLTPDMAEGAEAHRAWVMEQTLATTMSVEIGSANDIELSVAS
jgi:isoleucyl-tRNA synthetase